MADIESVDTSSHESLQTVTEMLETIGYVYQRPKPNVINCHVQGSGDVLEFMWKWDQELTILYMTCTFDLAVPPERIAEAYKLICLVNAQLSVGHLNFYAREGIVAMHAALPVCDGTVDINQCSFIYGSAMHMHDCYGTVFKMFGQGKSADEAMQYVFEVTQGSA